MTPARLKAIMRSARNAPPNRLADLYMEVYGAEPHLPKERTRASILEACQELLEARKVKREPQDG